VAQQKTAILSIDVTTGSAKTIASFPGNRTMKRLSPDERTLEMFNTSGPTPWPRWEIGADQEIPGSPQDTYTSRDGRWALRSAADSANRREFQIRPASSGDKAWEHLVYVRKQSPDTRAPVPWEITRDGNWLLYVDLDSDGKDALFRVNTSGGEPQRLGGYPTSLPNSYLVISPDGRQFLVETVPRSALARGLQGEYWLLQNFLPRAATLKP
jgi:hypothetical protein